MHISFISFLIFALLQGCSKLEKDDPSLKKNRAGFIKPTMASNGATVTGYKDSESEVSHKSLTMSLSNSTRTPKDFVTNHPEEETPYSIRPKPHSPQAPGALVESDKSSDHASDPAQPNQGAPIRNSAYPPAPTHRTTQLPPVATYPHIPPTVSPTHITPARQRTTSTGDVQDMTRNVRGNTARRRSSGVATACGRGLQCCCIGILEGFCCLFRNWR